MSPLSLDKLENELKDFQEFLNTQPETEDIKNCQFYVSELIKLIAQRRAILPKKFNSFLSQKYGQKQPDSSIQ